MLRIPTIKCSASKHAEIYQTGIKMQWLVPFLLGGYDPRSQYWNRLPDNVREMYEKLQRKTAKDRRERIKNYVTNRMSPKAMWIGAFPPIVIGMPRAQTFIPDTNGQPPRGDLQISPDMKNPNILLDGLGRVTSLLDAMEDEDKGIREWAQDVELPVMLITGTSERNLSHEELGQLFYDFNTLSVPVAQGQAIDLDQSDRYIQAASAACNLAIIANNGGADARAVSIGKSSDAWVTKSIMLKAVRAAAQGPGSHVDHIREEIDSKHEWMKSPKEQKELVDRIDNALTTFVAGLGGNVPEDDTLLRTAAWWIAFGLVLNDLYRTYEGGGSLSDDQRTMLLRRMAKIDWGLGNPELGFLGYAVPDKATGTVPTDAEGREVLNRFHGGSKAYYNLAAFIRAKIGLRAVVTYGSDYGTSVQFDSDGKVLSAPPTPVTAAALGLL